MDTAPVIVPDARSLPVSSITVPARLRRLRDDDVAMLMESIAEIGLREPISVCRVTGDDAASGIEFVLVAGYHRLEACKRLRHDVIPAIVHTLTDDERQLWEIDENLYRAELTELERGENLLKRKEIHERMHPETRQHAAGALAANAVMRRGDATANSAVASFATDAAEKTGIADRTIRLSIRRAKKIDDALRDRIRGNLKIADNGSELDALASLDAADQLRAVELVEAGTCPSIRAASVSCTQNCTSQGRLRGKRGEATTRTWTTTVGLYAPQSTRSPRGRMPGRHRLRVLRRSSATSRRAPSDAAALGYPYSDGEAGCRYYRSREAGPDHLDQGHCQDPADHSAGEPDQPPLQARQRSVGQAGRVSAVMRGRWWPSGSTAGNAATAVCEPAADARASLVQ
jgi:ParB family transcriptional regulator, chromosome partitioning protein